MPTRFYLPGTTAAPPISPAVGAGWTATAAGLVRYRSSTTKANTGLTAQTETAQTATNPSTTVMRQYIIGPVAAQTISGTISGVIKCSESNGTFSATLAICIRQVDSSGAHVADMLGVSASDLATTVPPEMALTAAKNTRRFQDAAESATPSLTSRTMTAGDYIVIEIGYRKADTSLTRSCTLDFHDDNASDYALTDALTTDLNPWVEFSGTVTLLETHSGDATSRAGAQGVDVSAKGGLGAPVATTGLRGLAAGSAAFASQRVDVSWIELEIPEASSGVSGSATGRTGAQGVCVGVKSTTSANADQVGARGLASVSGIRSGVALGSTGARALAVGAKGSLSFNVGGIGPEAVDVGAKAATSGATSKTGARGLAVGSQVEQHSGGAIGSTRASGLSTGTKATTVSASVGSTGTQGVDVGAKSATSSASDSSGARALDVGTKASTSTATGETGATALDSGTSTRSSPAASTAGLRGATLGGVGGAKAALGSTGARGTTSGAKAGASASVARSGVEALDTGTSARSGASVDRAGTTSSSVGAPTRSSGASATSGARGLTSGAVGGAKSAVGSTGARGLCVGVAARSSSDVGRTGTQSLAAGARTSSGAAVTRSAARGLAAGVAGTPPSEPHTGTAASTSGARGTSAGFKAATSTPIARVGARALCAAGPTTRTGAPATGRTALRAANVGTRATSGSAVSSYGARGHCEAPSRFFVPGINFNECESPWNLPDVVVWPPGIAREPEVVGPGLEPSGFAAPPGTLMPWEI